MEHADSHCLPHHMERPKAHAVTGWLLLHGLDDEDKCREEEDGNGEVRVEGEEEEEVEEEPHHSIPS